MRVIVTRPQYEAQRWAKELSVLGLDAVVLPLIAVGPAPDSNPIRRAWRHIHEFVAVMFVSGNAVDYFFALQPVETAGIDAFTASSTRAWATGPGTTRALLRARVSASQIDSPPVDAGQFDSEALWQVVAAQVSPGTKVLIVRGDDGSKVVGESSGTGRDWLANRVALAGGQAQFVVAYQRGAPQLDALQREVAQQGATDGSVWLLSSSEALHNLCLCLPGQDWSKARAVATHPRIATVARSVGFGTVLESRPTLPDVVASLGAEPQAPD